MSRQGAENRSGQARAKKEPWQDFEGEVAELVEGLDSGAFVEQDAHIPGLVSGTLRQLDALVRGQVVGQNITIAIEAKRYKRPVSIGTIDEFVGKLLDVGCDRGVLYAAGGFTEGALSRASNARNPGIGCVHLPPRADGILVMRNAGLSPLEQAFEEHLDRILGVHRTQEYDEWLRNDVANLYRH
ncbi:restriction endonuclease [Streptomyces sp. NBC_01446]|uniref:restriction endonuclease n=1 Tax=Streptomyces sp. NBC_01446 TaxID=2903870 RepID=UPI002253786F|nr:restriction endonuclease [Streptomyces sp. NBC_01446]MCX4641786.1 restriction endonuclease [Streptomyces sp. NBC_01446]